jgi:guanine deaminase
MPVGRLELAGPEALGVLDPFNAWNSLESRTKY